MIFVAISPQNIPPFDPCAPHIVDTKHSKHDAPGTTIPDTHGGTLETGRTFLFRTGQLGRDIFSRVVYGARISPYVSLISVGVGATMGGVVSSYFGSKFDPVVQRLVDSLQAFPAIILALQQQTPETSCLGIAQHQALINISPSQVVTPCLQSQ